MIEMNRIILNMCQNYQSFSERKYVWRFIIKSLFNVSVEWGESNSEYDVLEFEGAKIQFNTNDFALLDSNWMSDLSFRLVRHSLSIGHVYEIDYLGKKHVPSEFIEQEVITDKDLIFPFFFLLSGYHEAVLWNENNLDEFGRFKYSSSVLYENKFIVTKINSLKEYELEQSYKIRFTCDVDYPFYLPMQGASYFIRRLGGLLSKLKIINSLKVVLNCLKIVFLGDKADPNNTYDYMLSSIKGVTALDRIIFYFIVKSHVKKDSYYSISDLKIKQLIKKLISSETEIGVHSSYMTNDYPTYLKEDYNELVSLIENQNEIGNRYHYLRWHAIKSPVILDNICFYHDSSVGYSETIGFRSGICYPYYLYNLEKREQTNVLEYPLVIMDATILSENYMFTTLSDVQEKIQNLIQEAKKFNGVMTVLWHNDRLVSKNERGLFKYLLKCL
jgi:hypothetical protein